ncbi:hypothetical protein FQN54_005391 [Arachnomyces sp. PD_36]|nr:hypothetical protein FQN54_005391 [Arachnomyces sp. PD_36]
MSETLPHHEFCVGGCNDAGRLAKESENSQSSCRHDDNEDLIYFFRNCLYCPEISQSGEEQDKLVDSTQEYINNCESEWTPRELQSISSAISMYGYTATFTGAMPTDQPPPTTTSSTETRTVVPGATGKRIDYIIPISPHTLRTKPLDMIYNGGTFQITGGSAVEHTPTLYAPSIHPLITDTNNAIPGTPPSSTATNGSESTVRRSSTNIIGIVIAVAAVLAAILIGGGVYLYIRRRQKRKRKQKLEEEDGADGSDDDKNDDPLGFKAQLHGDSYDPRELPDSQKQTCFEVESGMRFELPANEPPARELMGGSSPLEKSGDSVDSV